MSGSSHITQASAQPSIKVLHDLHGEVVEGPTWDDRTQRLYFVDINKKKIYWSNADGSGLESIDTPETVGTIALTTDENLLLAAMNRSVFPVNIKEKSIGKAIATVPEEHGVDQMRFNDGKASPGGVFLVGRMHLKFSEGEPGRFYRLHWETKEKGHFEELKGPDEIGLPNGIDWDDDTCYHADTYHRTIIAYEIDKDGVPLRKEPGKSVKGPVRVHVDKNDGGGPDGICLSENHNLWVALPQGSMIKAYDAKTGKEVNKIELPVKNPTAVSFGGPNLETLYVTSMHGDDESEHYGSLLAIDGVGERGLSAAHKVRIPSA